MSEHNNYSLHRLYERPIDRIELVVVGGVCNTSLGGYETSCALVVVIAVAAIARSGGSKKTFAALVTIPVLHLGARHQRVRMLTVR